MPEALSSLGVHFFGTLLTWTLAAQFPGHCTQPVAIPLQFFQSLFQNAEKRGQVKTFPLVSCKICLWFKRNDPMKKRYSGDMNRVSIQWLTFRLPLCASRKYKYIPWLEISTCPLDTGECQNYLVQILDFLLHYFIKGTPHWTSAVKIRFSSLTCSKDGSLVWMLSPPPPPPKNFQFSFILSLKNFGYRDPLLHGISNDHPWGGYDTELSLRNKLQVSIS